MNIIAQLFKIQKYISGQVRALFCVDVIKQKRYVDSISEPRDDIERSFFQYRCQRFLRPWWLNFCINFFCLPILMAFVMKVRVRANKKKINAVKKSAVFISYNNSRSILPDCLEKEFSDMLQIDGDLKYSYDIEWEYVKQLVKRYPVSWEYNLKILIKLACYQAIIDSFLPEVIITTTTESSYASSVLTDYCNKKRIEHINVMHGEKLYYIRDSFFRFNRCFVWDKFYCDLFSSLRADSEQFIIERPVALAFSGRVSIKKNVDFTYYLGLEDADLLRAIYKNILLLKKRGFVVAVRPHPVYSDISLVKSIFKELIVEDWNRIPVENSILRAHHAVSLYSTCLQQAFYNGTTVVIDDISDCVRYNKIKDTGYIMLNKDHLLLSDILTKISL